MKSEGDKSMKSHRFSLPIVLMSLCSVAFAQSDMQMSSTTSPVLSDAQKSFAQMKTLAGSWLGTVTTSPPSEVQGKSAHITLRVTSMGNALVHEIRIQGRQDDPITMLYLDEGRLLLTHYCDAGNRPRMVGKTLPGGKTVEFEFLDIAGNPQYHMHHSVFTFIDATHHSEDWTFMVGDKPVVAHFELQRAD
jgi:hypothetical protein